MKNHKNKNNPNFKHGKYCKDYHNYCKICGKEIDKRSKKCISCSHIKHGRYCKNFYNYCIDCKKEIDRRAKRCCSCSKKKIHRSKEWKKNVTKAKQGKKLSKKHKQKISESHKGLKLSGETKRKLSLLKGGTGIPHENSVYPGEFNNILKEEIRVRDNFKCQYCGMTQEEHFEKYGKNIEVHHIDYNRFNCKEDNLITLCKQCNISANFNRDYWFAYYKYIMENKI